MRGRTPDANRTEPRGARRSSGEVVALFPAGGARQSPTPEQLDAVLAAFRMADRLSLRRLRLLSDLPHELVVRCVERLAADGLLAAERRPDGNESRGIASLTDEGRRSLERPGTATYAMPHLHVHFFPCSIGDPYEDSPIDFRREEDSKDSPTARSSSGG